MAEGTGEGTGTGAGTGTGTTTPPAWVAQLPADLKDNSAFTSYPTIGDLAKAHLDMGNKVKELDGLKAKLDDSIPKLPDNATDEEKGIYYNALGRPEKAELYEFEGEDKNAPEWTGYWKQQFHALGFTKAQAKNLSALWNSQMQKMVEAHNANIQNEMKSAETKLRTEMGEKFDTNVELAKRMWTKYGEGEFDKAFSNGNSAYRATTIRMLLKFASLTGEDRSPQAGQSQTGGGKASFINYDKSPTPPKR